VLTSEDRSVTTEVDLQELLDTLTEDTKTELASTPAVDDWNGSLDVSSLPITARKWIKVPDVVSVVADLKNSTRLGTDKWAASTASIYQAGTGGVVKTFDQFGADFIQIQGDGAFALFWGDQRYERALCAAITIRTFSDDLVQRLESKWSAIEETGFKLGVASQRVLVKRIGTPRNPAHQEPVWAGKPVNYAAKAAQSADRHQIIVTGSVWDKISGNDYLTISCGCDSNGNPTNPTTTIWEDMTIERLPEAEPEPVGRRLIAPWCKVHGPEFCAAILDGKRVRSDAAEARMSLLISQMGNAIRVKAANNRENRRRLAGILW
jgi:class 3 adenylate cyclase